MPKVVMKGKWMKDQKRWSTVVAMPEAVVTVDAESPSTRDKRKPRRPAKIFSWKRPRSAPS